MLSEKGFYKAGDYEIILKNLQHKIKQQGTDHADATNYRPEELTSCPCKILERIINKTLYYNFLSEFQSGFLP